MDAIIGLAGDCVTIGAARLMVEPGFSLPQVFDAGDWVVGSNTPVDCERIAACKSIDEVVRLVGLALVGNGSTLWRVENGRAVEVARAAIGEAAPLCMGALTALSALEQDARWLVEQAIEAGQEALGVCTLVDVISTQFDCQNPNLSVV